MAKIQCKMCGGELTLPEGVFSGNCEYCGSLVTFPRVSSEHLENLYNRAEHFRRINDYDKAVNAYEKVVNANPDDPEAYWGLVLSRFGIEYVADPVTHERIPTCHRVQFESILADADYLAALERAGAAEKEIYEAEAHRIAEIQKGILTISSQEEPFDVFICYKESDENGKRTKDSALAQEIYYALTQEKLKVFFARITLENKLGQQYEPYIFAALNSAKAMLVIGTKPEYFNAVWVRNEWSRYLALMKHDRKKLLIPCYKGMDAYDIPDELSMFQAQDMGKIGFIQDIIHGVKKVAAKTAPAAAAAASAPQPGTGKNNPLLRRAQIFVESGDFNSAREFCENVLNQEPENGWAYFTRMMAELQIADEKDLETVDFSDNRSYQLAQRFADEELKAKFAAIKAEKERVERQRQAMFAAKRLDVELRNGINERINLLQKHLECEKSLQKRLDVIAALEKAIAQEKGLLNRNELLTKDTVQPTREYSIQTMAAAGDLEEKESKCYRKKFIEIALVMGAFFAITLVVLMIGGCVKKNDLASGDVCKFENNVVVGVRYDKEDITKVVIPSGVTEINGSAFYGCSSLTSVTIPNSVTYIGVKAFSGCRSLTSVTIPDSVTEIGYYAFKGCSSLKEVIVPEKCKIADNAFPPKCLVIKLPAELVTKIRQGDADALAKLKEWRLALQQGIEFSADRKTVTGVKNENITTATIPFSVTKIGEKAFSWCNSLTSVTIPDSVTYIGNYAFSRCTSLKEVIVPGKCKIADNAFPQKCLVIRVDAETREIMRDAANGNAEAQFQLGEFYYKGKFGNAINYIEAAKWYRKSADQGNADARKTLEKLEAKRLELARGDVCKIENNVVCGVKYDRKEITKVVIPHGVTKIGESAFSDRRSLTSVTIPDSVTEIGDGAFSYCSSLTSVTIPDSVTKIGERAFEDCSNLTSVTIPDSVTEIGRRAFSGCTSLTSVTIPYSVTHIDGGTFYGCSSLTSVTIPNSVTKIRDGAFSGCSSLTSVTISYGVTEIGIFAFSSCSSLTSVTIPYSVTHIDGGTFYGCSSLKEVSVPYGCSVGNEAFPAGCKIIRY